MNHNHEVVSVSVPNAGLHPGIYGCFNWIQLTFRRSLMCYILASKCLLSFRTESFVFQVAIQKLED